MKEIRRSPIHSINHVKPSNSQTCPCYVLLGLMSLSLVGCGTTSALKPTQAGDAPSIQKYDQVSVLDFGDKTPKPDKLDEAAKRQLCDKMVENGRHFSDLLALELTKTKAFEKVNRVAKPEPGSLVISGDITRCVEGSSSLRFWIGMGAGSSYFDALVLLGDGDTGRQLGQIVVDKNSWALGGGIASGQTVRSFMEGAAKKVAAQIANAKTGVAPAK